MAASSRARYSVSAWVRELVRRSRSASWRSRSAWRFWASRISGAAYDACSDRARVRRMNGYGSKAALWLRNRAFQPIQRVTTAVWNTR
jgi:hypothetical protein